MHVNFNSFGLELNGGNRCILELTDGLVDRGYKVTITHLGSSKLYSWYGKPKAEITNLNYPSLIARALRKYYLKKRHYCYDHAYYLQMHIPDCDVNVATWCMTAYPTVESRKGRMYYLVQHYEPLFFPEDKTFVVKSAATYQLPMTKLCVSHWLTEKVNGVFIGNGVNLSKFKPLQLNKEYDVMVIPREYKLKGEAEWKGNYSPIVDCLRASRVKILEVKNVSEQELVKAYNISKIFLYLSNPKIKEGFGYPPAESFACGTPVMMTPCTEFANPDNAALIPEDAMAPEDICSSIRKLLKDERGMNLLSKAGLETAQELDLNKTISRFEDAMVKT